MKERTFHPVADLFPMMGGAELRQLADDIRTNGLREGIVLHPDGRIVDGRNRWVACETAGIEPHFRTWDEHGSLVSFVLSLNLHRRHLDESQRAMVAAKIANLGEGRPSETASIDAVSQADAAEMLSVSRSSVQRARDVLADGTPELVRAVEEGRASVYAAAALAELPAEEQVVIAEQPRQVIIAAAREVREPQVNGKKRRILPLLQTDGPSISDRVREAADVLGAEEGSELLGIGIQSFRRARLVVLLAVRPELTPQEQTVANEAVRLLDHAAYTAAYETAEPLIKKYYGSEEDRRGNTPERAVVRLTEEFETAFRILLHACAQARVMKPPPGWDNARRQRAAHEIGDAIGHLRILRRQLTEEGT